jgi:hypothetical protein
MPRQGAVQTIGPKLVNNDKKDISGALHPNSSDPAGVAFAADIVRVLPKQQQIRRTWPWLRSDLQRVCRLGRSIQRLKLSHMRY